MWKHTTATSDPSKPPSRPVLSKEERLDKQINDNVVGRNFKALERLILAKQGFTLRGPGALYETYLRPALEQYCQNPSPATALAFQNAIVTLNTVRRRLGKGPSQKTEIANKIATRMLMAYPKRQDSVSDVFERKTSQNSVGRSTDTLSLPPTPSSATAKDKVPE